MISIDPKTMNCANSKIKHIIPSRLQNLVLVKCWKCSTLYAVEQDYKNTDWKKNFGICPVCKTSINGMENEITATEYKFIRWWRSIFSRKVYQDGTQTVPVLRK